MTTINSAFYVNGVAPSGAVAVTAGSTVTAQVIAPTGIAGFTWAITGTDSPDHPEPTLTISGSPSGSIVTFTMPADYGDGLGQSYLLELIVSDGRKPATTLKTTAVIGCTNAAGVVPIASSEELERSSTHGWTKAFNQGLASTGRSGTLSASSERSIDAVATAPGWYVVGTFPVDATANARLDLIAAVSDLSLTLSARIYCITAGSEGAVTGTLVTINSTVDARVLSSFASLTGGRLYQVQAQVVGNAGADYFGIVRRAAPAGV